MRTPLHTGREIYVTGAAFALALCLLTGTAAAQDEGRLALDPGLAGPRTEALPALGLSPGQLKPPDLGSPGDLDGVYHADPGGSASKASKPTRTRRIIRNGAYILYFYEHDPVDDETFLHILGLFWYRGKPDWKLYIAAPFGAYWHWKDQNRWGLISPLVWHVEESDYSYTGAWLWHQYESPQRRFSTLFPFYWHNHDLTQDDNLYIFGPLYWRNRPDRWNAGLVPLVWMGGGDDYTALSIIPLFTMESTRQHTRLISPVLIHYKNHDTDEVTGSIPLLANVWHMEDDDEGWFLQLPLFFRYWDDDFKLTITLPLTVGVEEGENRFGMVFPIFFGFEDDETEFRLLIPALYARWNKKNRDEYFGMLGPLYTWRDETESGMGLWPFIKVYEDTQSGDATTMILPIYYASNDGEAQHRYFLPFLYGHSTFDDTHNWTVFGPFYDIESGDDHYHGMAPLVHVHTNDETNEETTIVAPVYAAHDDEDTSFRLIPPLLYLRSENRALDTHFIIAGPAWYDRGEHELSYGLAPAFIHWEAPDEERYFTLIPGLFYNNEGPDWATTFVGPAFRKTSPEASTWGLLPLGLWHEDHVEHTTTLAMAPGIYWSHGPERRRLLVGPLWSFRDGPEGEETKSDGLLPLVMRYREPDGSGFFFAPGLLDIHEAGDDGWDFTWLLSGFRYRSRGGRRTTMVAPLFLETSDETTGDYWAIAPPWIYVGGNDRTYERTIFAPPFFYDRDLQETDWLLFPLAFGHDDPELSYWLAGPLAFHYEEKTEGGTSLLLGPLLFGRYTSGDNDNLGSPEGLDGEPATDTGWMGPFVWSDTHERRFRLLFPLILDWEDFAEEESLFAFFPLFFQWQKQVEGVQRRLDAYVPLYIRYSEILPDGTEEASHFLGPLFAYDGEEGYGFGAFPLFWHDRTTTEGARAGHDIVFPLLWHFFDEGEQTRSLIAGPLYSFTEPGEEKYGVLPFWFHKTRFTDRGEEGYDALFPFYWYGYGHNDIGEETATLLTPAGFYRQEDDHHYGLVLNHYFSRHGDEETDFFFPLVYSHRDTDRDTLFVAPLYWHTDSPTWSARLVAPLYWHSEDHVRGTEKTIFLPYINTKSRESETDIVLPLFYQSRHTDGDLFRLIAPLYLQIEDGTTGSQFVMAGPIWYDGDGAGGYDTGVFPLLWWGEDAEEEDSYVVAAPVFWRFSLDRGEDTWTVLTPFWHHSDPGGTSAGLFPLLWYNDDTNGLDGHSVALPFWWRSVSEEGRNRWTVLTPLWHHADDTGTSAGLFPLMWWRDEANGVDGHSVAFPFWFRFVSDEGQDALTVAPPFWHHRHQQGYSTGLFPLAFVQENLEEEAFRLGILPFYYSNVAGETTSTLFPLYFGKTWSDGSDLDTVLGLAWDWDNADGTGGTIVGPGYHIKGDRGSSTGIFPIANWSHHEDHGDRAWLFPVAYYNRSADGEQTRVIAGPAFYDHDETGTDWGLAPLFWRFEDEDSSGSALFPAYYYEGRDDGHTLISPLAYSRRQGDDWNAWSLLYAGGGDSTGSWHTVFPLFFGRRSTDGSSLDIALPFYVNFKQPGGRSGGLVLFPFYWNFFNEEAGSDATVLFPVYWSFENQKRDFTLFLTWFHSKRKDVDRVTHGLVPLYYYSRDPGGYTFNIMGGLFGIDHTRAGDLTDYQLLWIPF